MPCFWEIHNFILLILTVLVWKDNSVKCLHCTILQWCFYCFLSFQFLSVWAAFLACSCCNSDLKWSCERNGYAQWEGSKGTEGESLLFGKIFGPWRKDWCRKIYADNWWDAWPYGEIILNAQMVKGFPFPWIICTGHVWLWNLLLWSSFDTLS